jgi:type III restriction enzyme
MSDAIIENPVINSPFVEPRRHFKFGDDGITDEIVDSRRISSYFVPIARPRNYKPSQLQLPDTEWTSSRIQENEFINRIRARVAIWRKGGYVGITRTTARLLEHWHSSDRERRLFFCQIEALETLIYVTEVASKYGARGSTTTCVGTPRKRIPTSFALPARWPRAAVRPS